MRIRLSDEDRERYGAPEWLEVDMDRYSVAEAQKLESTGLPAMSFFSNGLPGFLARVWIGLLRAGVTPPVSVGDMDEINIAGHRVDNESPGKAPSARRSTPTPSRSATTPPAKAGRLSRGKSNN